MKLNIIFYSVALFILTKEFIIKLLYDNDWKIKETASLLGIDRPNLFKKMQSLGVKK